MFGAFKPSAQLSGGLLWYINIEHPSTADPSANHQLRAGKSHGASPHPRSYGTGGACDE